MRVDIIDDIYSLMCFFAPLTIWMLINIKRYRKSGHSYRESINRNCIDKKVNRRKTSEGRLVRKVKTANKRTDTARLILHVIWVYIFALYCYIAAVQMACIGTIWDLICSGKMDLNINVIPFYTYTYGKTTYVLNVIMFMPLGFLLPYIWKRFRKPSITVITGLGLSVVIEFCQLFTDRITDIDDLLMNTLGTLLGYLVWFIFKLCFEKSGERSLEICKNEALKIITIGVAGVFFIYYRGLF